MIGLAIVIHIFTIQLEVMMETVVLSCKSLERKANILTISGIDANINVLT